MPSRASIWLVPDVDVVLALMRDLGLNRTGLTAKAGLHRNTLLNLCRGQRNAHLDTISSLAQALETSPFFLLTTQEEENDGR